VHHPSNMTNSTFPLRLPSIASAAEGRPPLVVQGSEFPPGRAEASSEGGKVHSSKFWLHTILADPASDTSALAAWVDEAQWLARSSNHILADRLPDTSALGSAIDEAQ